MWYKAIFREVWAILLLCVTNVNTLAQAPVKQFISEKIVYEGIFGFQLGRITALELTPLIGYKVNESLIPGAGFTYLYSNYRDYYLNLDNGKFSDRKANIYGPRVFVRYYLKNLLGNYLDQMFLQTEYEYLLYTRNYKSDPGGNYVDIFGIPYSLGKERVNVPGFLVGGGFNQYFGGKAYGNVLILYNLNETRNTPYSNPIIRIGFGYGL